MEKELEKKNFRQPRLGLNLLEKKKQLLKKVLMIDNCPSQKPFWLASPHLEPSYRTYILNCNDYISWFCSKSCYQEPNRQKNNSNGSRWLNCRGCPDEVLYRFGYFFDFLRQFSLSCSFRLPNIIFFSFIINYYTFIF